MRRLLHVLPDGVLFLLLLAVGRGALLGDPGTYWHVEAGRRMAATGAVLRTDPFSFLHHGEPWVAMQWLAELAMAAVHGALGLPGLALLAVALLAGLYGSLARDLRAAGLSVPLTATLVTVALGASAHHFLARPHLATLVLVPWTYRRLQHIDRGPAPAFWGLMVIPVVFVLWTNLHGGVLAGVMLVLPAVAGWLVERRDLPRASWVWLGAASLLALLVSPFGMALPRTWLTLATSPVLPTILREHAPTDLTAGPGVALLALAALLAAMQLGAARTLRWVDLLPWPWLILALRSARHGPLFAALALLALASAAPRCTWLVVWGKRFPTSAFALQPSSPSAAASIGGWRGTLVTHGARVGAFAVLALVLRGGLGPEWLKPPAAVAPFSLLPALRAVEGEVAEGSGILNEMDHGGFLIRYVPRLRVLVDDRVEVHGAQALARYVELSNHDGDALVAWGEEAGTVLALAPSGSPLESALRRAPRWREIARTMDGALFRRRDAIAPGRDPTPPPPP